MRQSAWLSGPLPPAPGTFSEVLSLPDGKMCMENTTASECCCNKVEP